MGTIPADTLVDVLPSVQGSGGSAVAVIGLCLTNSNRPPLGEVLSFSSAPAVSSYFGSASAEAIAAGGGTDLGTGYFGGFEGSAKKPSNMLFAQYNEDDVGAFVRGGNVSTLSLAQLQAISGTLAVTIDGVAHTGSPNLSAATSFSDAATIIADTLDIEGGVAASFTGTISGTALTVSSVTGTIAAGQLLNGVGVTPVYIVSGSGLSWVVSSSQTIGPIAMTSEFPGVSYDSVSGAFVIRSDTTGASSTIAYPTGTIADDLKLRQVDGAVISQGAVAAVPATFMSALIAQNRNWVTFFTCFDPDDPDENTVKQAFAAWNNGQNKRFAYLCGDSDEAPTVTLPATSSLGYILDQNDNEGTALIWQPSDQNAVAFVSGAAASIDFSERNGRISFAFKRQSGLVAGVTDPTIAANLGGDPQSTDRGNGYSFYGAYGNANENFVQYQRGFVTGEFSWLDSYINQVWFNSLCQSALLNLQQNARSIAYDDGGRTAIEAALKDPIDAALNFGMFGPGPLSSTQIAAVNQAAGARIATTLQTQGYYLQVGAATASVRAARTSPPAKLWYIDKGAVQAITLNSIALQ